MEKKEPSYTVDGNVNWWTHCGEQYGAFLKKLKIELLFDLKIIVLSEVNQTEKERCHMRSLRYQTFKCDAS